MALEPAKSEPNVAVKRIKYCLAVTRAIVHNSIVTNYPDQSQPSILIYFKLKMLRKAVRGFATAASKKQPPRATKHHKKKNHFATAGLPLVLFIVGGYVALTQFVGGKYEARDHQIKSQSEHMFNLEEEHKKMTKKLTLDDFELKPVPKPKEE